MRRSRRLGRCGPSSGPAGLVAGLAEVVASRLSRLIRAPPWWQRWDYPLPRSRNSARPETPPLWTDADLFLSHVRPLAHDPAPPGTQFIVWPGGRKPEDDTTHGSHRVGGEAAQQATDRDAGWRDRPRGPARLLSGNSHQAHLRSHVPIDVRARLAYPAADRPNELNPSPVKRFDWD